MPRGSGRKSPDATSQVTSLYRRTHAMDHTVVHFEIPANEPERAAKFYRELFGWEISRWGGAEDGCLLSVRNFHHVHGFSPAAQREPCFAADTDVAHPLGFPTRRNEVALTGSAEGVDRGALPLAGLAALHRKDARTLHAQAQST